MRGGQLADLDDGLRQHLFSYDLIPPEDLELDGDYDIGHLGLLRLRQAMTISGHACALEPCHRVLRPGAARCLRAT